MRCLNHPDMGAVGSCMFCGNLFCDLCLESVGERKLCLDCIEAMAEASVAIEEKSFLTEKQIAAGAILILLGFAVAARSALDAIRLMQGIFLVRLSPMPGDIVSLGAEAIKMLAYFVSGYGVLMSRSWSYWLGLAISLGTLAFAMYGLLLVPSRFGILLLTASATVFLLIVLNWKEQAQT
ncbi:MAG: hypothetical protein V1909_02245 [Candidatus Micrarchaeota archaeon]